VIVAAVLMGKAEFAGPRTPALSAVAFVTQSARRTLTAGTADVIVSGTLRAGSQVLPVRGAGETDFGANSMAIRMSVRASGRSITVDEVQINGYLYMTFTIDGRSISALTGGRHWIQTPVQQSGTANLGGTDPSASLTLLEQGGNTVRTLGTKIIGGVKCTGYSVTPSRQTMIAAARQVIAVDKLPAGFVNLELQIVGTIPVPTYTAWFDANELMREMRVSTPSGGVADSVTGDLVMDFTNYGAPVRITPPAPSDTMQFSAYLHALSGQGGRASAVAPRPDR